MLKHFFGAGLLALGCASAHASVQSWDFSYSGFFVHTEDRDYYSPPFPEVTVREHGFSPALTMVGALSGEDLNRDGVLDRSEVRYFTLAGLQYRGDGSANPQSDLRSFSYTIGGGMQFQISHNYLEEYSFTSVDISSDGGYAELRQTTGWEVQTLYTFTPQTQFAISPTSPVPEPASYAMYGLGLACLAGWARRRRA